jgi:hypothetical protein
MKEKMDIPVGQEKNKTGFPENTIEIVDNLESFLAENKIDDIKKFLSNSTIRSSLVYDRGRKNKNQLLFLDSFNSILEKESSGDNLITIDGQRLIEIVHSNNIPEETLLDLVSIAYHIRDEKLFYKLINEVILENRDKFREQLIIDYAEHHLATWKGIVEMNKAEMLSMNDIIKNRTEDENLRIKADYGRTFSSENIKVPEKIGIFKDKILPGLENENNFRDAIRAKQEIATLYLVKAKNIKNNSGKNDISSKNEIDNLVEEIIKISQETLDSSKEIAYSNAEIIAFRLLADVYEFRYSYTQNKKDWDLSKKYKKIVLIEKIFMILKLRFLRLELKTAKSCFFVIKVDFYS